MTELVDKFFLDKNPLTEKEKELILMGVNAVLTDDENCRKHALLAFEAGVSYQGIAEVLMAAIITRGLPAWLTGVHALEEVKTKNTIENVDYPAVCRETVKTHQDALAYLSSENGNISSWAQLLDELNPVALVHYAALREQCLSDGSISRKVKELVIIGLNLSLNYVTGLDVHVKAAKLEGASEEQIEAVFSLVVPYLKNKKNNLDNLEELWNKYK